MIQVGQFSADAKRLIQRLQIIADDVRKDSVEIMRTAAKPLIADVQMRAPQSNAPHKRYKKGVGVVAMYMPGNLKRSINDLRLRRKKNGIVVGPKVAKGDAGGIFSGAKTDAYYAHMVEFGTIHSAPQPFMRPAVIAKGDTVMRIAETLLRFKIKQYDQRPPAL